MELNILANLLLVILLLIQFFWIMPKLKFIDQFLKAFKDIGNIYREFFENFKKWKEEFENQYEKLSKEKKDLETHFEKLKVILGDIPAARMSDEIRSYIENVNEYITNAKKLLDVRDKRIKELENSIPTYHNIEKNWIYQALMHNKGKNKKPL